MCSSLFSVCWCVVSGFAFSIGCLFSGCLFLSWLLCGFLFFFFWCCFLCLVFFWFVFWFAVAFVFGFFLFFVWLLVLFSGFLSDSVLFCVWVCGFCMGMLLFGEFCLVVVCCIFVFLVGWFLCCFCLRGLFWFVFGGGGLFVLCFVWWGVVVLAGLLCSCLVGGLFFLVGVDWFFSFVLFVVCVFFDLWCFVRLLRCWGFLFVLSGVFGFVLLFGFLGLVLVVFWLWLCWSFLVFVIRVWLLPLLVFFCFVVFFCVCCVCGVLFGLVYLFCCRLFFLDWGVFFRFGGVWSCVCVFLVVGV